MAPWRISVDVGGTFTDCVATSPEGEARYAKVLSSGVVRVEVVPGDTDRGLRLRHEHLGAELAPLVGARLGLAGAEADRRVTQIDGARLRIDRALPRPVRDGDAIDLGTGEPAPILAARLVTRSRVEQPLPPCDFRVATTRATNALLARRYARAALIVTEGFADLLEIGDQRRPELFDLAIERPAPITDLVFGVSGRVCPGGRVVAPLDETALRSALAEARARGAETVAIALINAWANDEQERRAADIARDAGFDVVVASSVVARRLGLLDRAQAASLQAALTPVLDGYLDAIAAPLKTSTLRIMASTGGLLERAAFSPVDSLLSGPAGGVIGATSVARAHGHDRAISFDMGGTSTDVARIDGEPMLARTHRVGPFRLARPAVGVETVAAGGGSICHVRDGRPAVGPDSAGATPGPACYGAGGPLTITDVNLLLGRLDPQHFEVPVSIEASREALRAFAAQLDPSPHGESALLEGLLDLANERMAEAIAAVSVRQGYDPADHVMVAFGGAGAQHACAVAERLRIRRVLVPTEASVLSAVGVASASDEASRERTLARRLDDAISTLPGLIEEMAREATPSLPSAEGGVSITATGSLRLEGQESAIEVSLDEPCAAGERFRREHARLHGVTPDRPIEIVAVRVVVRPTRRHPSRERTAPRTQAAATPATIASAPPRVARTMLESPARVMGPTLVVERRTTTWTPTGWSCGALHDGTLELRHERRATRRADADATFARELTLHRLTAVAEHMGEALERSAVSTNVKERRDYSCGVLDARGRLVASAAHIPVHLGALGPCVRGVIEAIGPLEPGDACLTNHPGFGGSHLPDLTVIQAAFDDRGTRLGYVASRAHHAEIGGLTPGSMPPDARCLADEGVPIAPMFIARRGAERLDDVARALTSHRLPTRALDDNLADLGAALAAGRRAADALREIAMARGRAHTRDAMGWIIDHTARLARDAIRDMHALPACAVERMDNGAEIRVRLARDGERLEVDFTGTSPTQPGNINAPLAVTRSAVAYVLRAVMARDIPLNDGLLEAVRVVAPEGCFLNPRFASDDDRSPAAAGGNVETSQRIAEALIRALELAAGGPGTMNNTLLGNDGFSVYETIGGGAGATHACAGAHGVHTHMTNTAITDAEALERRHPLRVLRFGIRRGSGGSGRSPGGDGLVREVEALEPMRATVLTQRRDHGAPGLDGGGDGAPGAQFVVRSGGAIEPLAWADTTALAPGDRLIIETPGGGAAGS